MTPLKEILPQELIRKKRCREALSAEELQSFFGGYLAGKVADYQVAAMLMAITLNGMSQSEAAELTKIMLHSGKVLTWDEPPHLVVDKHSTGGVGDKTSLILVPLCALAGLKIPMISGRGLGHTGGTLDKLEAIPGMNVQISADKARAVLATCGGVFMGQTEELSPLDKRLYAMRDVTATVESIPLITASILSKKLAEGLGGLCMDIKCGSGAFMNSLEDARALAKSICEVGKLCGLKVSSLITSMNSPLGTHAGNALEIYECMEVMSGRGPASTKELTLALAEELVWFARQGVGDRQEIRKGLVQKLNDGSAMEKFYQIISLQGGSVEALKNAQKFIQTKTVKPVHVNGAGKNARITKINVRQLGLAVQILGGGRRLVTDKIDPSVGLSALKRIGESLFEGEPVAFVHGNDETKVAQAVEIVKKAYQVGEELVKDPLIIEKLGAS